MFQELKGFQKAHCPSYALEMAALLCQML